MSSNVNNPAFVQAQLQPQFQSLQTTNDNFFMFFMTAFIFFMQFGFGLFEAGIARTSYSIKRTLVKNFLCCVVAMVSYWLFGYALAFGGNNVFGGGQTYWATSYLSASQNSHFWLQFAFAVTSTTIAVGALSERCHIVTYLLFSFIWSGFAYPIVSHWAWTLVGFLYMGQSFPYGNVSNYQVANLALQYLYNPNAMNPATVASAAQYLDLSGSGVVHLSGGIAALIGALLLGPRTQRFDIMQSATFVPHSSTLMAIGCAIIYFGMLAFNCAGLQTISIVPAGMAAMAMVNTVLSAGAGMAFVFCVNMCKRGTYDLFQGLKGGLAGTVAISCSAGVIYPWGAVIVGAVAALSYLVWSVLLVRWKVDDVTDAFAVHAGAGMWGLISFAFLHPQFGILASVSSSGLFLAWQLAGIACVWAWCGIIATIIFGVLRLFAIIRLSVESEMKGVDVYSKITGLIVSEGNEDGNTARDNEERSDGQNGERPVSSITM